MSRPRATSRGVPRTRPDESVTAAVARARLLLLGLFVLTGLVSSSWLARIPAVRTALGMNAAELGGIMIVGSIGSLLSVSVAGWLVGRFGGRMVLYLSSVALFAAYVLIGLGPTIGSAPVLAIGIFLSGSSSAMANVPLNVETAAVERRIGRTVLPQFHAAFSIGSVLGSGIGALAAHARVPLLLQFTITAVVATIWRAASVRGSVLDSLPPDRGERARAQTVRAPQGHGGRWPIAHAPRVTGVRSSARPGSALRAWREPRTLMIGVVIMAAALSEGSANNWLALAVVDGFGQSEAVGATMFGVFVAAMTMVRLGGTRLIDRYGRVIVLRISGAVSLLGLVLFAVAPALPLAVVGIIGWGCGAALSVPIGIAAASDDPLRAAARVSVVSSFSSTASLVAPPLLGLAAEALGVRHALLLITAAMVASALTSGAVRRQKQPAVAMPEAVAV